MQQICLKSTVEYKAKINKKSHIKKIMKIKIREFSRRAYEAIPSKN